MDLYLAEVTNDCNCGTVIKHQNTPESNIHTFKIAFIISVNSFTIFNYIKFGEDFIMFRTETHVLDWLRLTKLCVCV